MKSEAAWEAEEDSRINEARVFVELKQYIIDAVENETLFFVLSELHNLYQNRLKDFKIEKVINRFILKNRILAAFPEAQEQNDGRKTVIIFKKGLANILRDVLEERDFCDETVLQRLFAETCSHTKGLLSPVLSQ